MGEELDKQIRKLNITLRVAIVLAVIALLGVISMGRIDRTTGNIVANTPSFINSYWIVLIPLIFAIILLAYGRSLIKMIAPLVLGDDIFKTDHYRKKKRAIQSFK